MLVVDEAHRMKNQDSLLHRTLTQVRSRTGEAEMFPGPGLLSDSPLCLSRVQFSVDFRVLLTGTPIQNNLQELYALLSFIQPNVFKADEVQNFVNTYSNVRHQAGLGRTRCR